MVRFLSHAIVGLFQLMATKDKVTFKQRAKITAHARTTRSDYLTLCDLVYT